MSDESIEFSDKGSIIEIYREKIRDLIEPSKTNL
jgi:kinesin family protein 5